jgi:DNA polymerase III subunit beta
VIVSVLQENLKRALSIVGRAVAGKSTLPVLSNVYLGTDAGQLVCRATNLEIGVTTRIGAKIESEGATTLPYKLLSDVVGGLPNDRVSLTLDAQTQAVALSCARYDATIKGIDHEEFPVIPTVDGDPLLSLPGSTIKRVAEAVAIAAATGDTRPVLSGVLMKYERDTAHGDDYIVLAAADGYRLAQMRVQIESAFGSEVIVPARALIELARIVEDDDRVDVALSPTGGQLVFRTESMELVTRLIEGKYPDVDRIIPASFTTRTVLDTAELVKAVKLASYFATKSADIVRLEVAPENTESPLPGKVTITANAAEVGDQRAVLDAMIGGTGGKIAVNVGYFAELLAAVKTPQVALEMQSEGNPLVMKPVGEDGALWILMPMTVR